MYKSADTPKVTALLFGNVLFISYIYTFMLPDRKFFSLYSYLVTLRLPFSYSTSTYPMHYLFMADAVRLSPDTPL